MHNLPHALDLLLPRLMPEMHLDIAATWCCVLDGATRVSIDRQQQTSQHSITHAHCTVLSIPWLAHPLASLCLQCYTSLFNQMDSLGHDRAAGVSGRCSNQLLGSAPISPNQSLVAQTAPQSIIEAIVNSRNQVG